MGFLSPERRLWFIFSLMAHCRTRLRCVYVHIEFTDHPNEHVYTQLAAFDQNITTQQSIDAFWENQAIFPMELYHTIRKS